MKPDTLFQGCNIPMSLSNLRPFVTGDSDPAVALRQKVLQKALNDFLTKEKDKVFPCPHPNCAGLFRKDGIDAGAGGEERSVENTRVQCTDCAKDVCKK